MAAYNKFNSFVADMANGVHNFASHTFKVCLTNSAPSASNTILSNITQIANANGYTTGGATLTLTSSAQTAGLYKYIATAAAPTWTANTGNMGPFEYIVLYNSTAANGNLIGWWDYGSALTLNGLAGETFTFTPDPTNGIFQLQ